MIVARYVSYHYLLVIELKTLDKSCVLVRKQSLRFCITQRDKISVFAGQRFEVGVLKKNLFKKNCEISGQLAHVT